MENKLANPNNGIITQYIFISDTPILLLYLQATCCTANFEICW